MRILLAYSGDLTTTVAIPWLREHYHADVITATIDLGPGRALEAVRDRALAAGAIRAHVVDARDEFARDHILPSLKADALHEDRFVMAVPLSRPLIARKLVEIAEMECADAVAHGASHLGGVPTPLDVLIQSVSPALRIIAVQSSHPADPAEYARAQALVPSSEENVEANLWGRSVRYSPHDPMPPEEAAYALTRSPAGCPDEPAVVEIAFDRGIPRAINGVFMPLLELIASLGIIAGIHGVGRAAGDGRLSEAPAAVLLHAAHRQLQSEATAGDLQAFARAVSLKYIDLVCHGLWFTPLREALDAFVDKVQERVTGGIRLKLFKGNVIQH